MKRVLIISILISSCYTEIKKPDYAFMQQIKQQALLDSTSKTNIELHPKNILFGSKKKPENLKGFFYIKNTGNVNFNLIAVRPDCDCIVTKYKEKILAPNDSLKVIYEINFINKAGHISNTIAVVGNCQFGNQTFYMEGIIINQ